MLFTNQFDFRNDKNLNDRLFHLSKKIDDSVGKKL